MKHRKTHNDTPELNYQGSLLKINPRPKAQHLILTIQAQQTAPETIQQVWQTRKTVYNKIYPSVQCFEQDPYDAASCVIYTQSKTGLISSTARITFNQQPLGIPEQKLAPDLISQLTREHIRFAELGRFVIDDQARGVLKNYYRTFYEVGIRLGIDTYIIFVRQKSASFHARLMNAVVVSELNETFGSNAPYVVMTWRLKETAARFFSWSGAQPPLFNANTDKTASGVQL